MKIVWCPNYWKTCRIIKENKNKTSPKFNVYSVFPRKKNQFTSIPLVVKHLKAHWIRPFSIKKTITVNYYSNSRTKNRLRPPTTEENSWRIKSELILWGLFSFLNILLFAQLFSLLVLIPMSSGVDETVDFHVIKVATKKQNKSFSLSVYAKQELKFHERKSPWACVVCWEG